MLRLVFAAALVTVPTLAPAQSSPAQSSVAQSSAGESAPQRIRNVQVPRGQACPKSTPDEVVVCQTLEEPYRIPKPLRDDRPVPLARQSWVNRAAVMDETSRVAGGLPDTCSPVGTGGQSGCAMAAARQWAAEKKAGNVQANPVTGR